MSCGEPSSGAVLIAGFVQCGRCKANVVKRYRDSHTCLDLLQQGPDWVKSTEFRKDLRMHNDVRYALAQLKDAQELLEAHLAALTAQHAEKHKA